MEIVLWINGSNPVRFVGNSVPGNYYGGDQTLHLEYFVIYKDEKTNNGQIDITCSICLDRIHRPQEIDPCKHMFCQSCLIRMSEAGCTKKCPLCRGAINNTKFNRELNQMIRNQHPEDYLNRENLEAKSGNFLIFGSRTPYHRRQY